MTPEETRNILKKFESLQIKRPRREFKMVVSSDNWEICKKNGWTTPEDLMKNGVPHSYQYS